MHSKFSKSGEEGKCFGTKSDRGFVGQVIAPVNELEAVSTQRTQQEGLVRQVRDKSG